MDTGLESFLDCAYEALNLTFVTVGRHEVEVDWTYFVAHAFEFLIGVNITRGETSRLVQFNGADFLQDDVLAAIVNGLCGAETYAAHDRMEERESLYEENICAYRDVAVVFKYWGWNWHGLESRHPRGGDGARGLAFEHGNVWPIYNKSAFGDGSRDWAITHQILVEDCLEFGFVGSSYLPIQFACYVRCLDFSA